MSEHRIDRPIAGILWILFAFGFGFSAFLLLPKYLTELGANATSIGRVAASTSVAVVLTTPLSAYLVKRVRRRALVQLGAVMLGVSSLGFLVVVEPGAGMLALRAMQGVAFSLFLTSCSATVVELAPPERLGRMLGYVGGMMLASNAVAPGAMEPVVEWLGWSSLFVAGALSAAVVFVSSLKFPQTTPAAAPPTLEGRARSTISAVVGVSLCASAATGFAFGAVATFAPGFAMARGAESISSLFLGYTAAALGVRIFANGVGDRFGHARVAVIAVLAYALVVLAFVDLEPEWLPLLGAALGLAHGFLFPSLNALALIETPAHRRGGVQAFFFGAFHLGMACSGLVLGAVADHMGFAGVFLAASAVSLAAGFALVGVSLRARRKSSLEG